MHCYSMQTCSLVSPTTSLSSRMLPDAAQPPSSSLLPWRSRFPRHAVPTARRSAPMAPRPRRRAAARATGIGRRGMQARGAVFDRTPASWPAGSGWTAVVQVRVGKDGWISLDLPGRPPPSAPTRGGRQSRLVAVTSCKSILPSPCQAACPSVSQGDSDIGPWQGNTVAGLGVHEWGTNRA
jgi:hypothetical protein